MTCACNECWHWFCIVQTEAESSLPFPFSDLLSGESPRPSRRGFFLPAQVRAGPVESIFADRIGLAQNKRLLKLSFLTRVQAQLEFLRTIVVRPD